MKFSCAQGLVYYDHGVSSLTLESDLYFIQPLSKFLCIICLKICETIVSTSHAYINIYRSFTVKYQPFTHGFP